MQIPRPTDHCQLCLRSGLPVTKHHLIPRGVHRRKRFRKAFDREDRLTRILWVCRPCHNAIHSARSEQELAMYYNTREKLLEIPELRDFVHWIQGKPPGFKPKQR